MLLRIANIYLLVLVGWLLSKEIKKLVLVVLSAESRIVRERWEFEVVLLEPEGLSEDGSVYVFPLSHSSHY